MRNQILIVDTWIDPNHQPIDKTYLDAKDWELFVNWIEKDNNRKENLSQGKWKVTIFRDQLFECFGEDKRRDNKLKQVGIVIDKTSSKNYEMFITEALRAYFNNNPAFHPQAKLLSLARRSEANNKVQIISQYKYFWRIPDVDTYYVDEKYLKGFDDLPANFDFFLDMRIHRKIWQVASDRINNGDNPTAIIESVKTLFDEIRTVTGSTKDGHELMGDTLGCQRWQNNLPAVPLIKLNDLVSQSEWNEQKGFRDIACGIASALRNPIAHQPADQAFIQARYGDKRTTLKVLCLLSLLLEKIDKRVI